MNVRNKIKNSRLLSSLIRPIARLLYLLKTRDYLSKCVTIENHGYGNIKKDVSGSLHKVIIGKGTTLSKPIVRIKGTSNKLIIGENCKIGPNCEFFLEGNNIFISIGANTSFTNNVEVNAQEDNSIIQIGEDCMISNHIIIRTSDSHPIYDIDTGKRINPAKNVTIGNHVWIAPHSTIMKGAVINNGSIVGSNTVVTKVIPNNSLAVGIPAKVVKQKIKWTKEMIIPAQ